jgi:hypothetical protein
MLKRQKPPRCEVRFQHLLVFPKLFGGASSCTWIQKNDQISRCASVRNPIGIFVPNPGEISTSSAGKSWLREDLPRKRSLAAIAIAPTLSAHARSDSSRRHDRRMETRSASALHPVHRWRRTRGADTISSVSDQIFEFSQRLNRFSAPLLPNTLLPES